MSAPLPAGRSGHQAGAVLTIGELATHVGVTVRAIRHYHQRGLLAEPVRDASGYRRYGLQAVVDLIRIKTLAAAGVPLSRIHQLLDAGPEEFAQAVADIDHTLERRVGEIQQLRRELGELMSGERLVLPAEVAALLEQMRALGVRESTVALERDGWTLLMGLAPDHVAEWAAQKSAFIADPLFQRVYLEWDEAYDWDVDDPRLLDLAAAAASWLEVQPPRPMPSSDDAGLAAANRLLAAQMSTASPAWRRLEELYQAHLTTAAVPAVRNAAQLPSG
jgi:DNA-binding transcriptional MerR regulator